jgi:hypothetical protein
VGQRPPGATVRPVDGRHGGIRERSVGVTSERTGVRLFGTSERESCRIEHLFGRTLTPCCRGSDASLWRGIEAKVIMPCLNSEDIATHRERCWAIPRTLARGVSAVGIRGSSKSEISVHYGIECGVRVCRLCDQRSLCRRITLARAWRPQASV